MALAVLVFGLVRAAVWARGRLSASQAVGDCRRKVNFALYLLFMCITWAHS